MQQDLQELNAELARTYGVTLRTYGVTLANRIGVNTGGVVAGDATAEQAFDRAHRLASATGSDVLAGACLEVAGAAHAY